MVGEIESILLAKEGIILPARIDTGATTSSLGVEQIILFERDGQKWVRFTLQGAQGQVLERPISRRLSVKVHEAPSQKRVAVTLSINMGGKKMRRDFSLTDRSQYKFPVLIGRNVLSGEFLVDVSRQYISSPFNDEGRQ